MNSKTKVCIICHEHGEFWQTPNEHKKGCGCPICGHIVTADSKRLSKEDFIKKANEIHKGKYNYDKVVYKGSKTNVYIICHEHGEFEQRPQDHIKGQGCPKCANEATSKRCRWSKEDFIKKAIEIHKGKYDYTNVEYKDSQTKVRIICPEHRHGEFWQTPAEHIRGKGCPKCGGSYAPTTEEWIASARKVHGDKYDYSKVNYVSNKTKVCIICPKHVHGEFWQLPSHHTQGVGCPTCNLSHLERSVMNYFDEHEIAYDYQKRFNWLGRQSLDFYLPDYNVGIECQGGQHFFPVEYFGGDNGFKQTLERDKRKKALCEKHGVKLLYFGDTPNYNTFLGEVVHDDVQHIIDYLK
nr:MAG TPA: restriction enzyme [Ackermannviridae sp.]